MQNLLIPLGIIVLMSVLGYLTQVLKRAADKRQMERDRNREPVRREPIRTGSSDIDRFLRAVDAQRQKGGPSARPAPPPKKADIPTAAPVRRPRVADTAAPAFPEAKKKAPPAKAVPDDLPVATVVGGTAAPVVTAPAQLAKPQRASAAPAAAAATPTTPFGRQFAGLLKGSNALALAVALQEVLGLDAGALELTWRSLAEVGNLSSSSVLHVLHDTMTKRSFEPGAPGVLLAMGPGFCSEVVLLRW